MTPKLDRLYPLLMERSQQIKQGAPSLTDPDEAWVAWRAAQEKQMDDGMRYQAEQFAEGTTPAQWCMDVDHTQRHALMLLDAPVWLTADRRQLEVRKMELGHLLNAMCLVNRWLKRMARAGVDGHDGAWDMLAMSDYITWEGVFTAELQRRCTDLTRGVR